MRRRRLRILTSILVVLMAVQLGLITTPAGARTTEDDFELWACNYLGCEEACNDICNDEEKGYTGCKRWEYNPYYTCGDVPGRCSITCDREVGGPITIEGCCMIVE